MRKVLFFTLAASVVFTMAGCLKDQKFEDQEYQTVIGDAAAKGIAFPEASKSAFISRGVERMTTPQVVQGPLLALEQEGKAASDVKVTISFANSNALVTAADPTWIPLTVTQFSLNTTTVTIPAGASISDFLKVSVTNAFVLDPTKTYGVGLTISAVDGGYTIAANQKNIVVSFNIKNKYDGIYRLKGWHNRTSPDYTKPYDVTVHLITTGPNSVSMWYPDPGPDDYAHPINGSTGSYYGVFTTNFTFDPDNVALPDKLVSWNLFPYPNGATTCQVGPATDSRWVAGAGGNPAKIFANFYYNNNPGARAFFDTLTFIEKRP
jgi:hypothetical protein